MHIEQQCNTRYLSLYRSLASAALKEIAQIDSRSPETIEIDQCVAIGIYWKDERDNFVPLCGYKALNQPYDVLEMYIQTALPDIAHHFNATDKDQEHSSLLKNAMYGNAIGSSTLVHLGVFEAKSVGANSLNRLAAAFTRQCDFPTGAKVTKPCTQAR